ncbi:MAG: Lrp/AsnC family transcriptional regulator [Telmatospirillum sp.]|nr:Lrp/AsnC family transcriptional regulator [Telmatospirillum sp.]
MDEFDDRILAALTKNARASNLELEAKVGLSHSAISRRIARLEKAGIIEGYGARIDRAKLGLTVRAFVGVTRDPSISAEELAQTLAAIPGVAVGYVVTGDQDVFLEVFAKNLQDFADLMLARVQSVRGVATTRTIFVMREWRAEAGAVA